MARSKPSCLCALHSHATDRLELAAIICSESQLTSAASVAWHLSVHRRPGTGILRAPPSAAPLFLLIADVFRSQLRQLESTDQMERIHKICRAGFLTVVSVLLVLLALCSRTDAGASPSSAASPSPNGQSSFFPSLHTEEKYQRIHLYAEPIHVGRRRSGRRVLLSSTSSSSPPVSPFHSPSFPQTSSHLTYLLHVKTPITRASRESLQEYLHPFTLGRYIPHHTFLVTLPHRGEEFGGRIAIHSNPENEAQLANHPTSNWTSSQVTQWLSRAPGVLFAVPRSPEHVLHPKVSAAMAQLPQVKHEEQEWDWREMGRREGGSKRTLRHRPGISVNRTHASPSLSWHAVKLGVTLAKPPSSQWKEGHAGRGEEEAMQHLERTIQHWVSHLQQREFLLHSDREGFLRHLTDEERGELLEASRGLEVTWQRYDPRSSSPTVPSSPSSLHFLLVHPTLLQVRSSSSLLPAVLAYLASRTEVAWVEPSPEVETQNKFIRTIIQSDTANRTSIWDHSLRGEDEIIQLGDTGLDTDSCFFSDPALPVPVNTVSPAHRKIVTYTLFDSADHGDDIAGHGTHVGGSLIGEVQDPAHPLAQWNGMAPRAKVAFYDFKRSGMEDLLVPPSVYKPYLSHAYALGARVSSNSWGSPDGEYGSYCRELDQFVSDFPDFLLVFAAGNYGETGWNTVSSPGVSKNVLTVGSTKTSPQAFFEAGLDWGFVISGSGEPTLDEHPGVSVAEANFGVKFTDLALENVQVVVADPIEACSELKNGEAALAAAPVVIVRRGTCHFSAKASTVQSSSPAAKLLIVVNNEDGPPAHMAGEPGDEGVGQWKLSLVMVTKTIGESMISAWLAQEAHGNKTLRLSAPKEVDPPNENESVLSSFSSRGPTFGGRLKPDVLAPGEFVKSVKSDGTLFSGDKCPRDLEQGLLQLEGTSMATPMVAASGALIREYLRKGYYPSGVPTAADQVSRPPAALVKAMLVHSGLSASGTVLTKRLIDPVAKVEQVAQAPSYFQGFGRILLDLVLRFAPPATEAPGPVQASSPLMTDRFPNIALIDDQASLESEEVHSFCFLVSSPPPTAISSNSSSSTTAFPAFRATLTWTDPPVAEGAAFVLVNNLDLFVSLPQTRQVLLGNGFSFLDAAGEHPVWDLENNVEQVSVWEVPAAVPVNVSSTPSSPPALTPVLVHVRGTSIPDGAQRYSLVVTGWFEDSFNGSSRVKHRPVGDCLAAAGGEDHLQVLCPSSCFASLGYGNCSYTTGQCACASERTGADCGVACVRLEKKGGGEEEFEWRTPVGGPAAADGLARLSVPSDGWLFFSFSLLDFHSSVDEFLASVSKLDSIRITLTRTSSVGDPDLFVSYRGFPSLRAHDLADTQCDSCLGTGAANGAASSTDNVISVAKPSQVDLTKDKLLILAQELRSDPTQKVRIGIHGYCCDASEVTLSISPVRPRAPPSFWYWFAPLLVVILCLLLLVAYIRRKRRTQQGLDLMPLPVIAHSEGEDAVTPSNRGRPHSPSQPDASEPRDSSTPSRNPSSISMTRVQFMPLAKDELETSDEHEQPHA